MPAHLVQQVIASATPDLVLIGGQALAFWMDHYGVDWEDALGPAVARDVDFFTRNAANTAPLTRFATAIAGRPQVHDIHSLSALIGSAVAPAEGGRVYNVNLLHSVLGLRRESVEANAVTVALAGKMTLKVTHPIDVLQSRNANLHLLAEKQDALGEAQLRLAIEVARKYLQGEVQKVGRIDGLTESQRYRETFKTLKVVSDYSTEDAARKNAQRYGIHLADAIPAWCLTADVFWEKQWPRLRQRMSRGHVEDCERRAGRTFVAPQGLNPPDKTPPSDSVIRARAPATGGRRRRR